MKMLGPTFSKGLSQDQTLCCLWGFGGRVMYFINRILDIPLLSTKYSLVLFSALSAIYVFVFGFAVFPDSLTYIEASPVRTGGYPLVIKLFSVSGDYSLYALSFFQIVAWLVISFAFSKLVCRKFEINVRFAYVFLFVLCVPLNPSQQLGNAILTEALSYILGLSVLYLLFKFDGKEYIKYCSLILALFVFVQFVRPQLSFLMFVLFWVSFLLFFVKEIKKAVAVLVVAVVGFFAYSVVDKTYHYVEHDFYGRIPFVGTQAIALPFFFSSDDTIDAIENEQDKEVLKLMKQRAREANVHIDQLRQREDDIYRLIYRYAVGYNPIRYKIIHKVLEDVEPGLSHQDTDRRLIELTISILKSALVVEPQTMIKAYFKNILYLGFGDHILFLLCFVLLIVSTVDFLLRKRPLTFMVSVVVAAHFINVGVVSLLEPVLTRYSFYTSLPMLVVLLALTFSTITKKLQN